MLHGAAGSDRQALKILGKILQHARHEMKPLPDAKKMQETSMK
jgi:hypothetical protein